MWVKLTSSIASTRLAHSLPPTQIIRHIPCLPNAFLKFSLKLKNVTIIAICDVASFLVKHPHFFVNVFSNKGLGEKANNNSQKFGTNLSQRLDGWTAEYKMLRTPHARN
eukprot:gnl/MRDRNA2_/MRDRNA2_64368_c0_seq1.p1 gnl/MRDRNA2_/MRDRNA2_64368_c0~~gnl/MRDRNA2_/MRDRNA2_64368_c0_seq1.p1  ORF type:complete len:109 (-),score=1.93 gnl/MRDRNA2_/MRDRNA2_64368_c0_seq1:231-557(-)